MTTRVPPALAGAKPLADRLLAEGRISRSAYDVAMDYATRSGDPVEEALVIARAISEADLLKYLATIHQVRFAGTERLAAMEVDWATVRKVPVGVAEQFGVVPVTFDERAGVLSVVIADPTAIEVLDEVKKAPGVREVRPVLARPAAIRAAIRKVYYGDPSAFVALETRTREAQSSLINVYGANLVGSGPPPRERTDPGAARRRTGAGDDRARRASTGPTAPAEQAMRARTDPARGPEIREARRTTAPRDAARAAPLRTPGVPTTPPESFTEGLNVLVSLLENERPGLRGHSAFVARLVRKTGERLGLAPTDLRAAVIAAFVHDLGKASALHLTALNVAEYDAHRLAAEKTFQMPRRLFEQVRLSPATLAAVDGMYERYDGRGIPGRAAGNEIPLAARVLAIADTFADLTQNPRNPERHRLSAVEACDTLARYAPAIFDPTLVQLFRMTVSGEDLRAKLLSNRRLALLVDPAPEETTLLELRMVEHGFEVEIARTSEQAWQALQRGEIELVVSELDVEPHDGFTLLAEARKQPWGRDLPWFVLTRRQAGADAQRAFELGIVDYVLKPAATEVLVAKLKQAVERRPAAKAARGVSGSLQEIALPELVQICFHGRKSGTLHLRAPHGTGTIHFVDGRLVHATWGRLAGTDAFYALVGVQAGEFELDPNGKPDEETIAASPEALLLEGMRRLDEAARPGK